MDIRKIDHVQLAMPAGKEKEARAFYNGVLGIPEKAKPAHLAARGGVWFESGKLKVHLGVESNFRPAQKAHPAFEVNGLAELIEACRNAGYQVVPDETMGGYERAYVYDPFGNRIELMEPHDFSGA